MKNAKRDLFRSDFIEDTFFFDEGPEIPEPQVIVINSSSLPTTEVDAYRQGVEITHSRHYGTGLVKTHSGEPGHRMLRINYGQGTTRNASDRSFTEASLTNTINLIAQGTLPDAFSSASLDAYPILTRDDDSLIKSMDGVIEPLEIRKAVMLEREFPREAHAFYGSVMNGNENFKLASDAVVITQPLLQEGNVPFIDSTDTLGGVQVSGFDQLNADDVSINPFADRSVPKQFEKQRTSQVFIDYHVEDPEMQQAMYTLQQSSRNVDDYVNDDDSAYSTGWSWQTTGNNQIDSIAFGGLQQPKHVSFREWTLVDTPNILAHYEVDRLASTCSYISATASMDISSDAWSKNIAVASASIDETYGIVHTITCVAVGPGVTLGHYVELTSSTDSNYGFGAITFETLVTDWGGTLIDGVQVSINADHTNINLNTFTTEIATSNILWAYAEPVEDAVRIRVSAIAKLDLYSHVSVSLAPLANMTYSFEADGTEYITVAEQFSQIKQVSAYQIDNVLSSKYPLTASIIYNMPKLYNHRSDSWVNEDGYTGGWCELYVEEVINIDDLPRAFSGIDVPISVYESSNRLEDSTTENYAWSFYGTQAKHTLVLAQSPDETGKFHHSDDEGHNLSIEHTSAGVSGREIRVTRFNGRTCELYANSVLESNTNLGFGAQTFDTFKWGAIDDTGFFGQLFALSVVKQSFVHDSYFDMKLRQYYAERYSVNITSTPATPIQTGAIIPDFKIRVLNTVPWILKCNGTTISEGIGTGEEQTITNVVIPETISLSTTALLELETSNGYDCIRVSSYSSEMAPRMLPGVVGWWQVDESEWGLTLQEASIEPDLTTWSNLRCTLSSSGDGVYRMLDQVDASPTNHQCSTYASDIQNGIVTFGVTIVEFNDVDTISLRLDGDSVHTDFNLITHEKTTSTSGYIAHRVYEIPNVGWRYESTMIRSAASTFKIFLAKNGSITYQGDGTGYIDIKDATVTQRRITSVANRIPHGPPLVPFDAATAPKLYDAALNTWTGGEGFYCNELEGLRDSTTIAPMFSGTNVPFVVYHVCRGQTGVDGGRLYAWHGSSGTQGIYQHNVATTVIRAWRSDVSTTSAQITAADAYPANTRSATCDYFDGTTRTLSTINGTLSVEQELGEQGFARFGWACSPAYSVSAPAAGNFSCLILSTQSRIRGDEYDLVMRRWIANVYGVTV